LRLRTGGAATTAGVSLSPQYDFSDGERELAGCVAVHSLRVESGVNSAASVVDAAVGAGATRVSGVQFSDVARPSPGPVFAEVGDSRAATSFDPGDVTVRATVSVSNSRLILHSFLFNRMGIPACMRTRQLLAAVAVTALLVTGSAVAALQAAPTGVADAQTQPTDNESTIQVDASGSVEAEPDSATVRVSVTVEGDDVSAVREQLAENVSQMRTALEEMGVSDLQSTDYDIRRNHRARERPEEPQYVGSHSFEIVTDDPGAAGDVIVTAVENGASRIDGVRYTVTEETREQLRSEALAEAMGSARSQAETIANESNLDVRGVDQVRTTEVRAIPHREGAALAAGGADASTTLDGGQVTVSAQVVVNYEVE